MCVCALLFRRCARSEAGCRRIAGFVTCLVPCVVGRPSGGELESLENRRFPGGCDEMTEGCAALGGLRLRACTPWTPGGDTAGACGQGVHKGVDKSVDSVDSFSARSVRAIPCYPRRRAVRGVFDIFDTRFVHSLSRCKRWAHGVYPQVCPLLFTLMVGSWG